jgi:hypothetical protein
LTDDEVLERAGVRGWRLVQTVAPDGAAVVWTFDNFDDGELLWASKPLAIAYMRGHLLHAEN